jgi:hypothetical protein
MKEADTFAGETKLSASRKTMLLKSDRTTNVVYRVDGISKEQAVKINSIETVDKIQKRMVKIRECGGTLSYFNIESKIFRNNLIMVDSKMPEILGCMLLDSYSENVNDCRTLVDMTCEKNPIGYSDISIYQYKVKQFLFSCAAGLTSTTYWDGLYRTDIGFDIVNADGERIAYNIYNRSIFEQYLFNNAFFQQSCMDECDCMKVYYEEGEMYIKLNVQIDVR